MASGSLVSVIDASEGGDAVTLFSTFQSEGGDRGIQNLLLEQLTRVQQVLTDSHQTATSLVDQKMEAVRQVESELAELQSENQKLRARLESAGLPTSLIETGHGMGGTGESSSGPKPAIFTVTAPLRPADAERSPASRAQPPPRVHAEHVSEPRDVAPVMNVPGAPIMSLPGAVASEETPPVGATRKDEHEVAPWQDKPPVDTGHGQSVQYGSIKACVVPPEMTPILPRPPESQSAGPSASFTPGLSLGTIGKQGVTGSSTLDPGSPKAGLLSTGVNSHNLDLRSVGRRSVAIFQQKAHAVKQEVVGTTEAPKAVFADAAAMKEKLRQALHAPEYNVVDYYHTSGFWQKIAKSFIFEHLTLGVISFNAIWIAIDTDYNKATTLLEADAVFQVAEHTFCFFFTFEWVARFMSFKLKRNCLKDGWFIFDSTLVLLMVSETWVLTLVFVFFTTGNSSGLGNVSIVRVLRLLRLTRMARMARLLRAMPELMILIKGMAVAARSVFFTLCLLVTFIYVFAIAFTQLLEDSDTKDKYFPDVSKSMSTLLLAGTLPDHEDTVLAISNENMIYGALFLCYMLLGSLTVMNMLVGVLVEVVSVVSSVEKEQMVVNFVKVQLAQMMKTSGLDANHDNLISKSEFQTLLEKPEAARALQDVGVDVVGLVDFTDFIFKDGVELSFPNFMEMVLQLRGSNTATVKDIVDFRKFVMNELQRLEEKVTQKICSFLNPRMTPIQNISVQSKGSAGRYSDSDTMCQEDSVPLPSVSEHYQT